MSAEQKVEFEEKPVNYTTSCVSEYSGDIMKSKTWFFNGLKHREEDLPAETTYFDNGQVKSKTYYKGGMRHRHGKPASITYYSSGETKEEVYYLLDKQSRYSCISFGDLPSAIRYNKDGTISYKEWCEQGKLNRLNDNPTSISYYKSGNIKAKQWHVDDELHRENDKPAEVEYYDEPGKVASMRWFIKDRPFRENGLKRCIEYDEDGKEVETEIYDVIDEPELKKINVNKAPLDELCCIPFMYKEHAQKIIENRPIDSFEKLILITGNNNISSTYVSFKD